LNKNKILSKFYYKIRFDIFILNIVAVVIFSYLVLYIEYIYKLIIFNNNLQTRIDCTICAIELADPSKESWDDRETEVRWVTMNLDDDEQEINTETLARKAVEPVNEPSHEIVLGTTKCIQVLLNAIVAFSKYFCPIKEINFKDSLMLQVNYNHDLYHLFCTQIKL